jgi:hypothetical protein
MSDDEAPTHPTARRIRAHPMALPLRTVRCTPTGPDRLERHRVGRGRTASVRRLVRPPTRALRPRLLAGAQLPRLRRPSRRPRRPQGVAPLVSRLRRQRPTRCNPWAAAPPVVGPLNLHPRRPASPSEPPPLNLLSHLPRRFRSPSSVTARMQDSRHPGPIRASQTSSVSDRRMGGIAVCQLVPPPSPGPPHHHQSRPSADRQSVPRQPAPRRHQWRRAPGTKRANQPTGLTRTSIRRSRPQYRIRTRSRIQTPSRSHGSTPPRRHSNRRPPTSGRRTRQHPRSPPPSSRRRSDRKSAVRRRTDSALRAEPCSRRGRARTTRARLVPRSRGGRPPMSPSLVCRCLKRRCRGSHCRAARRPPAPRWRTPAVICRVASARQRSQPRRSTPPKSGRRPG